MSEDDITAMESFLRKLLHPEDYGHCVSSEVRYEARRLLSRIVQIRYPQESEPEQKDWMNDGGC